LIFDHCYGYKSCLSTSSIRDRVNSVVRIKLIVLICGLPGVGKSTLARAIAPLINAVVLSTDKIRKELIPNPTYRWQERRLIYDVLVLLAKYLHREGINCILDATFNTESSRIEIRHKLDLSLEQFSLIECICSEDVVLSRLKNRKDDYSDANIIIYRKMKKIYQPVRREHIVVDTSNPLNVNTKGIANQILKANLS
jgi:predicted kinase